MTLPHVQCVVSAEEWLGEFLTPQGINDLS